MTGRNRAATHPSFFSGSAILAVPFLLLPMVLGSFVLMVLPGHRVGQAAIILSTVAVTWYLLGGAIALSRLRCNLAERRALARIRPQLAVSPHPAFACDADGLVLFQNDSAQMQWGVLTGCNILTLLTQLRADAVLDLSRITARAACGGQAEIALSDGTILTLRHDRTAPLRIWTLGDDQPCPGPDTAVDAADFPLRTDGEFEALPVALLRLSRDGRVRSANASARNLLGMTVTDETDHPVHLGSLVEGPGRPVGEWIEAVCDGQTGTRSEILGLRGHPDHRPPEAPASLYFQVTISADTLNPDMAVAVFSDASALKTLEAQFAQSQKMHAVGQLAGGIAHDFNNLLTAISGHCDLLMLRHDKGDPEYADLDQISQNSNRAAALVGQLLAFSRKQTLKLETLDLRDTLADLSHLLNRLVGERVGLTIFNQPDLPAIRADKRQLEQVIMNLVVNARDAMHEGGEITVETTHVHLDQPITRDRVSLPAGDYVCIGVRDEGTGIDATLMNKIFEPFFTTKRVGEGTGLGLSTAYGIVKQTGGYIFCDSILGEGTCFSLYFPAQRHSRAQTPIIPHVSGPDGPALSRAASILLVEDEAPVRAFAVRALRLKGHDVLEADSAEAALAILSDSLLQIDVFVTDVVMPGMDGPTWVRTALIDRPRTRVIFMSGYTDDIFGEGHAPVAGSAFLAKPFTLAELTRAVARQLAAGHPG